MTRIMTYREIVLVCELINESADAELVGRLGSESGRETVKRLYAGWGDCAGAARCKRDLLGQRSRDDR